MLIELAPDAIFVTSANGTLEEVNACGCQMLGYDREELLGKAIAEFMPPESQALFAVAQPSSAQNRLETWTYLHKDGRPVQAEVRAKSLPDGRSVAFVRALPEREPTHSVTQLLDVEIENDRPTEPQYAHDQVRRILNSLFSFVGVMTPDGTLIEANRTALEAAGLQAADVLGKPFPQTYWWSFSSESQSQMQDAIRRAASGESVRYDARVRLSNDRWITVDFAIVPLRNEAGQTEFLIPSGIDITARKQSEAALQESEAIVRQQLQEIESIYNTAPIGLGFVDPELRFVRVNQRLAEINGAPISEHLGRTLQDVLPELADFLEPLYRQVIQTGEPLLNLEVHGTTPAQPGIDRDWLICYYPQIDADREVLGVNVLVQEITERKRAELALQEARIQLESALTAGSVYTWRWDIRDNLIFVDRNFADLFGINPETAAVGLLVEQFLNAIHPDDRSSVIAAIEQAIKTGEEYTSEYRVCNAEGQERWVIARGRVEYDAQGNPIIFPGALIDITDRKHIEAEFRQAEEFKDRMLQTSPDCIKVLDLDQRLLYLNAGGKCALEIDDFAPYYKTDWLSFWQGHDRQQAEQAIATAKAGEVSVFQGYCPTAKGTPKWWEVMISPMMDAAGQVERLLSISRDITERKRADEALRQSESRFRRLSESNLIGIIFWTIDGDILDANDAFLEMLGYTRDDLLAGKLRWSDLTPPRWIEQDQRGSETVLATGTCGPFEKEYFHKNGTAVPVLLGSALLEGSQQQGVSFVLDLSDRKRAEADLRQNTARLEFILAATEFGTWEVNLLSQPYRAEPRSLKHEQIYGYESLLPEWSYDTFMSHIHPDDRHLVEAKFLQTVTTYADWDVECRIIRADQAQRWVWISGSIYRDAAGQPNRLMGLIADITERKQAELEREHLLASEKAARQEAEHVNRLKDEFFSALSHELRTPLNPILGWTTMLRSQKLSPEKVAQALETIDRNVKQQIRLVDDLLDVSRVIQGNLQLNSNPVDLALILGEAIQTVQFAAQAKTITLYFAFSEPIYTLGDRDRLRQVFWNLLSNAVKFTPEGGRVEIELSQFHNSLTHNSPIHNSLTHNSLTHNSLSSHCQVRITDTGIGIEPEFLPYVFDHFRQAEGGSTRKYGGLGLGLTIVRHLVELHGGTVTAESLGMGRGATFTVTLPQLERRDRFASIRALSQKVNVEQNSLKSSPSSNPASSEAANRSSSLANVRIFVVDDEPDNLELLRFLLSDEGAIVDTFTSPFAALQSLTQAPPDLLISDIGMPEIDGYELIRRVRSLAIQSPAGASPLKAIALTAFAQRADQRRAIEAGYQVCLAKPVDPAEVIATIKTLLFQTEV